MEPHGAQGAADIEKMHVGIDQARNDRLARQVDLFGVFGAGQQFGVFTDGGDAAAADADGLGKTALFQIDLAVIEQDVVGIHI